MIALDTNIFARFLLNQQGHGETGEKHWQCACGEVRMM